MVKKIALATVATVAMVGVAQARDQIQIAGSSTVLPFASIVAEEFGNTFADFPTPVVGSGGSSGGLRQFCEGVGENTLDIANASRAIRGGEVEACGGAGVEQIHEIRIGYDGIVFASDADGAAFEFTPIDLYLALAEQVPVDGAMAENPYTNWSEIRSELPDQEIQLFIPGENHGTREVFEEKVLEVGCEEYEGFATVEALGEDAAEEACLAIRKDGRSVDIAGDYTETLARIEANPEGIGVFGLSFYENNRDVIQVATMSDVEPSLETIATGEYPVSRPLFFYVKGEHRGVIPGLDEYVQFFLSDQVTGADGILVERGLIPMPDAERTAVLDAYMNGETVSN